MECTLAVICEVAEVVEGGKLNIMGVFTDLNPTGPGLVSIPQAHVVTNFSAGPPEVGRSKTVRIVLLSADGKQLGFTEQKVRVPKPPRPGARSSMTVVARLVPLVLPEPGDYEFAVLVNGEQKNSVAVHVNPPPGG